MRAGRHARSGRRAINLPPGNGASSLPMVNSFQSSRAPVTLGAIHRLLEIGERAGLVEAEERSALIEVLAKETICDPAVQRMLGAFQLDRIAFYACVVLFSRDPFSMELDVLANEVSASGARVRPRLNRLKHQNVLRMSRSRSDKIQVGLTDLGREIAVLAIYRVLSAVKSDRAQRGSSGRERDDFLREGLRAER